MAASALFPHQSVAEFDKDDFYGRPDYPLVAVSYLEAEQILQKDDYGYDDEFWRQTERMDAEYPPILVQRGIRMLAFHFENGDTKVLANELYEREKASQAGTDYNVNNLLQSANSVKLEPGYLYSITFKVRDEAAKSYIDTLRIKTINKNEFLKSLNDYKAAKREGINHDAGPRLVKPKTTAIYKHDPLAHISPIEQPLTPIDSSSHLDYNHPQPSNLSVSSGSHPPYHLRAIWEHRPIALDDGRRWGYTDLGYRLGTYHEDNKLTAGSFTVDSQASGNYRTTIQLGRIKELEGVPDGVFEKRCVLWRGKKGYFWGALRALFPGASEGRIVALAPVYKNIGVGMGVKFLTKENAESDSEEDSDGEEDSQADDEEDSDDEGND